MSIPTDPAPTNGAPSDNGHLAKELPAVAKVNTDGDASGACSMRTSDNGSGKDSVDHTAEFAGDIDTNNSLPTREMIARTENLPVLDKDGRSRPFKSLYSGPNVARRVLVIFVRHFFCGVS